MRSRKRAVLITSIVGVFVLTTTVMLVLLSPPQHPSITLNDGRIFSFAGVTAGKDLPRSLKPTWISRNIGNPIVKSFPKSESILQQLGIVKPNIPPNLLRNHMKDDIIFWILTRSTDGKTYPSSASIGPEAIIVNGVEMEMRETESKEQLRPSGSGVFGATDNQSYSFIFFPGIRNQTERTTIILRQDNDQGALEESARWDIEMP